MKAGIRLMKSKNILTRKIPSSQGGREIRLKVAAIAAAIVFFILFFFRPFGLFLYEGSLLKVCLVFAAVCFTLTFLYCTLIIGPIQHKVKVWRVWHHALTTLVLLLLISTGNMVCDMLLFGNRPSLAIWIAYTAATFLIGCVITAVITMLSYQHYVRNKLELLIDKSPDRQNGSTITLHDDSARGNELTISTTDFLYAEVKKNNVMVYYQNNGKVETHEMRMTLTSLISSIDDPDIIQCHRSFVVNVANITSAKGNSNGYQLHIGNCPNLVPVSRSFVPVLKSFLA